ncbi:MAG TPA: IscS subfamily cysteine desulfurase [bacterium]|nr:IscS subfamily cysteine desulfurase [bacterium]HPN45367.1 IscS subfamily cysteine desulfurase [bacterium]
MKAIYMDHHATTPLDKEVLESMMPYLTEHFGNPSSNTHEYGHIARKAVEEARKKIADLIGAQSADEIIFTSGATEADNLAVKGIAWNNRDKKGQIITIATEHKAILDTVSRLEREGYEIAYARIDEYGLIDLDHLASLLKPETRLISIQTANSEIGTIQPIAEIGQLAMQHKIPFHTDAVQALGKVDINVIRDHIDMLSISAHKMYGPKGIGALYVRKGIKLTSLIDGGGHERGMRSGTLNVPGIVGLGKAAEIAKRDMKQEVDRLLILRNRLADGIDKQIEHCKLNGHPIKRLANNLNYSFAYVEGESLILACRDVALSSGSACTSTSLQSSYVLRAINVPESLAHCSIRFGLGKSNTSEQIDYILELLVRNVKKLREMSPLYDLARDGIDIDKLNWSKHTH